MFGGYVAVHAPDSAMATVQQKQYALEHRLVASQLLGRTLLPTEIVHHLDGNKANNAPNNLMVMSQSDHMVLHGKLRREAKKQAGSA